MSELVITSRDNSLAKHARAVRAGKIREQIFIEGLRLCEEAAQALSVGDVLNIIHTESFAEDRRGASLLEALIRDGQRSTIVSEAVFASISDTKTPQGIVLLASRPNTQRSDLLKSLGKIRLLVILHKINNPSNAGAILRTAEAAGAWAVILTEGTTDIFSPKALRGAMGSSFRLPLWTGASFDEALSFCREQVIRTVCADLRAGRAHTEIDWTVPSALIVGPEAAGLENAEIALADESLRIPMHAPVESLNVAVATGIILYEAARQRAVVSGQWPVVS
jgi:TrmH family RNA methyltransferase